jgi:hypothetical protein
MPTAISPNWVTTDQYFPHLDFPTCELLMESPPAHQAFVFLAVFSGSAQESASNVTENH